jgi:hypothetical protein
MSDQEIMMTIGLIQAPQTLGQNGAGAYNPFPGANVGANVGATGGMPAFGNQMGTGGNPAANLASQVGNGVPQQGEFSGLIRKGGN